MPEAQSTLSFGETEAYLIKLTSIFDSNLQVSWCCFLYVGAFVPADQIEVCAQGFFFC